MRLQSLLTASPTKLSSQTTLFWFSLSLTLAAIYSFLSLQIAFSGEYVVQDDARQHVFWMQRFLEPELFPNDLIADYFQTVAPAGYTFLYRVVAAVGINPLLFNKLLPVILSLITAGYCFGVTLQLLPVPAAAFSASLLLSQALGLTDAIVSGTPKAFIYPLFLAFIYYLLRSSFWPCLGAIALQGLFYPQLVLISAGTLFLRLWQWQDGRLRLCLDRRNRLICSAGILIAILVMLPYALKTNQFDPVISVAEARELPEFLPGGRARFFYDDDPWKFWLKGRGGIRLASALTPVTNVLGFLLPLLLLFPRQFPLVKQVKPDIKLLAQILLASFSIFFTAHALLFRLHLPSRYVGHSLRVVLTITAGMVLVVIIDAVFDWTRHNRKSFFPGQKFFAWGIATFLATVLFFYPCFVDLFPITAYQVGTAPSLYKFLQKQPKDSLIASLSHEANNLPTFSQRSILVGSEYAIPYHLGYYNQFRQRIIDLINAQYSLEKNRITDFLQTYGVDFWLLDKSAFLPEYLKNNQWTQQYQPAANQALQRLEQGQKPVLVKTIEECTIFETEALLVLETGCIEQVMSY